MVDWNGLLKWSMQFQDDGTTPSQYKEMSKEDRDWLQEAIKAYQFNDTDRLTDICKELKEDGKKIEKDKMLDLLEEL